MNLVTSNEGVTNTSLSLDQVADEVNTLRGRLIAEMTKTSHFRRPYMGFTQKIKELKVEKDDKKKSFVNVPRMISILGHGPAVLYIGGTDGRTPYRVIVGSEAARNAESDEFINAFPVAIYEEGLITFKNIAPEYIRVEGVFETPSDLEIFGEYDAEVSDYPFPNGMIDVLIGKTAESYLRTMYRVMPQPNTQSDIPLAKPAK